MPQQMNNLVLNFCFFVCDPNTIILAKFLDECAMELAYVSYIIWGNLIISRHFKICGKMCNAHTVWTVFILLILLIFDPVQFFIIYL